jgi:hypothetical protein
MLHLIHSLFHRILGLYTAQSSSKCLSRNAVLQHIVYYSDSLDWDGFGNMTVHQMLQRVNHSHFRFTQFELRRLQVGRQVGLTSGTRNHGESFVECPFENYLGRRRRVSARNPVYDGVVHWLHHEGIRRKGGVSHHIDP